MNVLLPDLVSYCTESKRLCDIEKSVAGGGYNRISYIKCYIDVIIQLFHFDAGNASTNEDSAFRDHIAHSVIQMHINSYDYTAKDLYQILLSSIKKKVNIMGLRDSEQFSLLHQVVARDRPELITVFYDLGFISKMHQLRVTDRQSAYFDMTPLAMAEHDRKRCQGELESCIEKDKKEIARKVDFAKLKSHVERKPEDVLYLSEGDCTYPIYWMHGDSAASGHLVTDSTPSSLESQGINFLHRQCQSTDPSSLPENGLKKNSSFVEDTEHNPDCKFPSGIVLVCIRQSFRLI